MVVLIVAAFLILSIAPFFRPRKIKSRLFFFFLWFFILGELSAYLGLTFQQKLWMKTWYIPPLSDIEYLSFWITETVLVTMTGFLCYVGIEYAMRKKALKKERERIG